MIYDVYFAGLSGAHSNAPSWGSPIERLWGSVDYTGALVEAIKTQPNDSFVFITTKDQEPTVLEFIKKHSLEDFLSFEMPYFVTNNNHPGAGRRLRLRVFQSKKEVT